MKKLPLCFDALDEQLAVEHDWAVILVQTCFQSTREYVYRGPLEYKARRELDHILELVKIPDQFQKNYGCPPNQVSCVLLCCDDKIETVDSWLE